MKVLARLIKEKKINPPPWLLDNLHYLTITGSEAYGCPSDLSDKDAVGICMEPREYLFPSEYGYIGGFDQVPSFEVWQQHHIKDESKNTIYDFSVYGIVKFFALAIDGNPNIVELLFTPRDCVLHSSPIGKFLRSKREIFLSTRFSFKCRMYAYSQLAKLDKEPIGKRKELVDRHGWDCKYLSHVYRLLLQSKQVLEEKTLDLRKNGELLKAVKRGEISDKEGKEWASNMERELESLEGKTDLQRKPDHQSVKNLLIECIEMHYGSQKVYKSESRYQKMVEQIRNIVL